MDKNFNDRLERMEERDEKLSDVLGAVENTVTKLAVYIEQIQEQKLEERVRSLENEMVNQRMVYKTLQWLAATLVMLFLSGDLLMY
jgi:hypothetical protein